MNLTKPKKIRIGTTTGKLMDGFCRRCAWQMTTNDPAYVDPRSGKMFCSLTCYTMHKWTEEKENE